MCSSMPPPRSVVCKAVSGAKVETSTETADSGNSITSRFCSGRRASDEFTKRLEEKREQLEAYETVCRELGHPPAEVALAWLLHNPMVTAPIIGPRTVEQLESAVRAAAIELEDVTLKRLDEIFPGPGGEAPVPYAW